MAETHLVSPRTCERCATELASADRFCPQCGANTDRARPPPTEAFEAPTPRSKLRSSVTGERFSPGQLLVERFRIVTPLGRGGMGEVFRADDLALGQAVALKFLPLVFGQDADRLQRLRGEVKTARQVAHPNVCRVYDLGEADGQLFITMEFVDGQNVGALLQQINRLPEERGIEIARQLCLGLGAIHDRGLLHRDLKPGNVMLDGRGNVRITDFGLAAPMEGISAVEVREGTPAYQSPEQLAGREVTARSDIYALGLVLYELFTGKKPFYATERAELAKAHAEDAPSRPSSHVSGLNPNIERIILKCLEKDPRDRPRTAYEVLASLPGGDPLQAALAAGQTPSPEMVANAQTEGTLHPLVGLSLGLATFALLAIVITLNQQSRLFEQTPHQLSPHELTAQARDLIRHFGYIDPPRDWTYGIASAEGVLSLLGKRDASAQRWQPLSTGQPPALYFWYRQGPAWMQAMGRRGPGLASHHGQVTADNPPFTSPGMVRIGLDMKGRLIGFQVVPDAAGQHADPVVLDWPRLLRDAGLKDMVETMEFLPDRVPPLFVDSRRAWQGGYLDVPDLAVRAEAGFRNGRLVDFYVAPDQVFRQPVPPSPSGNGRHSASVGAAIIALTNIAIWTIGGVLAWHNVRQRRANLRGAALLSGAFGTMFLLGWMSSAHHVPQFWPEQEILNADLGEAVYLGMLMFVTYLAVEPFIRRKWPWRIVAWNRLLAGRWRDPLVGRDLLVGAAAGALMTVATQVTHLLPGWLGQPPQAPTPSLPLALTAGPLYVLTTAFAIAVVPAMAWFFMIFVLFLILRREWLAAVAFGLFLVIPGVLTASGDRYAVVLQYVLSAIILISMYLRFGLLSVAVLSFVYGICATVPLTLDFGAWYARDSFVYLAVLAVIVLYGFVVASGRQALAWVGFLMGESGAQSEAAAK